MRRTLKIGLILVVTTVLFPLSAQDSESTRTDSKPPLDESQSSAATRYSVPVEWTPVTGATRYELEVRQNDTVITRQSALGSSTRLNLAPGSYQLRLIVFNKFDRPEYRTAWRDLEVERKSRRRGIIDIPTKQPSQEQPRKEPRRPEDVRPVEENPEPRPDRPRATEPEGPPFYWQALVPGLPAYQAGDTRGMQIWGGAFAAAGLGALYLFNDANATFTSIESSPVTRLFNTSLGGAVVAGSAVKQDTLLSLLVINQAERAGDLARFEEQRLRYQLFFYSTLAIWGSHFALNQRITNRSGTTGQTDLDSFGYFGIWPGGHEAHAIGSGGHPNLEFAAGWSGRF